MGSLYLLVALEAGVDGTLFSMRVRSELAGLILVVLGLFRINPRHATVLGLLLLSVSWILWRPSYLLHCRPFGCERPDIFGLVGVGAHPK